MPEKMTANPHEIVAELQRKNDELTAQQGATADVLKVIASSPSDVQPVFEAIAERSKELIKGFSTSVFSIVDEMMHLSAFTRANPAADKALKARFPSPLSARTYGEQIRNGDIVQIPDTEVEGAVSSDLRDSARMRGYRSMLHVPLLREGTTIGLISVTRVQPGPFPSNHVQLLRTFADQAVIAIGNVHLFEQVQARTRDLAESLQHQTATSDVLQAIGSSMADAQPAFDRILDGTMKLFNCRGAAIFLAPPDGMLHLAGSRGFGSGAVDRLYPRPIAETTAAAIINERRQRYIPNALNDVDGSESLRRTAEAIGNFSVVMTPMLWEGRGVGMISVTREPNERFNDKELSLLKTFADQAVIAIENARLFDEVQAKTRDLTEALTYQTGSSNILKVIASSPTDVGPVLKAIVDSACELCEAHDAIVHLRDGDDLRYRAHHGPIPFGFEKLPSSDRPIPFGIEKLPINRHWVTGRSVVDKVPVHLHDVLSAEGAEFPEAQRLSRREGTRTLLSVPLLREGESIGTIVLRRTEVLPFSDKQIALLQTFADQAVIAIGNVRMFEQVQERTEDLRESLQQQTATAEVLKVISRSAFNLQTVFDTLTESATELCEADYGIIFLRKNDAFHAQATSGARPEFLEFLKANPRRIDDKSMVPRVARTGAVVHIPDRLLDPDFQFTGSSEALGGVARTMLGVPLLRNGAVEGVFVVSRYEPKPFTQRQIELVESFSDQAVIALENVRLFDEVQAKTRDLTEALQQQTATADVLKVISRSAFDLQTVLDTLVISAARLCDADRACIFQKDGDVFRWVSNFGFSAELIAYADMHPFTPGTHSTTSRVLLEGKPIHNPDVLADPSYSASEYQRLGNYRTMLGVPLLREGAPIGVFILTREQVRPFADRQIELVTSFADQAVIAIENVRLFEEVQARTKELAASLNELRAAQDRLVQTEKLASLGQLTAGIAHEIKNPLNFVNNFSALSSELTDELNDVLKPAPLTEKMRGEVEELTGLLKDNLEKVVQHGKRADSIVKNMLLHSREGSGEHRPADINALLDESLNLAYHGARAEKSGFNITLQREFDADAGEIELFPQEITRAFLNLISNGFYAATKRKMENGDQGFEPILRVTTKNLGSTVEIRIRDNGTGVPAEVKEKMFNPFFTTKPAGEGTGLGLSMSHDIIVKQHGGSIDVETQPGQFTEFTIVLPRTSHFLKKI